MITLKESIPKSMSESFNSHTDRISHSHSALNHNFPHHYHNPWEKPNYATFNYQQTPYSFEAISSTGGASSTQTANTKPNSLYSIFDIPTNLHHSTSNFYRCHTELSLPTSNTIYSMSTANHLLSNSFNCSHTTGHYHPSDFFFGWNNAPSLMRTHSASYRNYPQTNSLPCYNPVSSQSAMANKSTVSLLSTQTQTEAISTLSTNNYRSYYNFIPSMNISSPSSSSLSHQKRSIPSTKKRSRLTAQLRQEILKLKVDKPTMFAWEIQQNLLQNGLCTAQTLPCTTSIQRILNEPKKSARTIEQETKASIDLVTSTTFNNTENENISSVTMCLSPSSSPTLPDDESASECSICLETYRSGQEVSILSCSHEYHSSCINEWTIKSRSCPICRKSIHKQPQFVTLLI